MISCCSPNPNPDLPELDADEVAMLCKALAHFTHSFKTSQHGSYGLGRIARAESLPGLGDERLDLGKLV